MVVTQHNPSSTPDLPTPEDLDRWQAGDRLAIAAALAEAARRGLRPDGTVLAQAIGPQTREELHKAVYQLTGYWIPRTAVCTEHGHSAPFDTFADMYFGEDVEGNPVTDVLWIGNRGGGKTTNSGFLHGAKGRYNAEYTSAIAGAVQRQGGRAYAEFQRFTRRLGAEVLSSILSKTVWANGAETEVLGGTIAQLNGPHPNLAQMDEVELTTEAVFQEFMNMAQGNARYPGQQLLTSTRKRAYGLVQSIVREVQEAEREGDEPPWVVRIFCVFETMAQVENCRAAPENEGMPEHLLCKCNKVRQGNWDDGSPRTFEQECGGKAYRADGFVHLTDVHKRFKQLSRLTWEAQQRCLRPNVEGLVHKWVNLNCHLPIWFPRPEFGPIYRTWDWGGTAPHVCLFAQKLTVSVGLKYIAGINEETGELTEAWVPMLDDDEGEPDRILPVDSLVFFDEIYGNQDVYGDYYELGTAVARRTAEWMEFGYTMEIEHDFCDPAGAVAKRSVKRAFRNFQYSIGDEDEVIELPEPRFKSPQTPVEESVVEHISRGEAGLIFYVPTMTPNLDDEYNVYHWPEKKPERPIPTVPVKDDDHAMDASRYLIWNLRLIAERKKSGEAPEGQERPGKQRDPHGAPVAMEDRGKFGVPRTEPGGVVSVEGSPVAFSGGSSLDHPPHRASVRGIAGRSVR